MSWSNERRLKYIKMKPIDPKQNGTFWNNKLSWLQQRWHSSRMVAEECDTIKRF